MQEISALPSLSVAVTFSCSGNRRQEVNFVKPSIGVSYGSGESLRLLTSIKNLFQSVYDHDRQRNSIFPRNKSQYNALLDFAKESHKNFRQRTASASERHETCVPSS